MVTRAIYFLARARFIYRARASARARARARARDIPTTTPGLVGLCVCTGCIHTKREPPSKKKKVKKNQKYLLESIQFDPIRLFRMSLISLFFFFFARDIPTTTPGLVGLCVCTGCIHTKREPPSKKKKVKKNQKYLLESIQFDPIRLFRMSLISLFFFFFLPVTYTPPGLLGVCLCKIYKNTARGSEQAIFSEISFG